MTGDWNTGQRTSLAPCNGTNIYLSQVWKGIGGLGGYAEVVNCPSGYTGTTISYTPATSTPNVDGSAWNGTPSITTYSCLKT